MMAENWDSRGAPAPRGGWLGELDRFIGPGATRAEIALELGAAFAAGLAMALYALLRPLPWPIWQTAVAVLIAFDLAGGVATNASNAAKRWYHRPGQGRRPLMLFTAAHGAHLLLVAAVFRAGDWGWAAVWFAGLLGMAASIVWAPRYLQRPLALLWVVAGLALNLYAFAPALGMEWFIPVFLLKLLAAHLVYEEPVGR
jgi:hypothetical protein